MSAGSMPKPQDDRRRLVSGQAYNDDSKFESSIRPRTLAEFVGHARIKEILSIAIEATRSRGEALDHVLLYGPPGLGKTTLATIIANELGVDIKVSSGPMLERKGDLTAILTALEMRECLFLDEIHRLQAQIEEILYPAMEEYRIDLVIGQGPGARIHPYRLQPFTLIGATTRAGLITAPLRSRFGIVHRLDFYPPDDLDQIVRRSAQILAIPVDGGGSEEISRRSRGTPRVANRLLRRVRDFAEVRAAGKITGEVARDALKMLEVDDYGFDEMDRKLLLTIIEKYDGGPVGVNTLAASIAEEVDAIEEIYEPFLIQIGFLNRTSRGRMATALAYKHFGLNPPSRQPDLF